MISRFEQFVFAVSNISNSVQKLERAEMERYGMRGTYAQYLVAIRRFADGVTAAQLCEICDKDKAAVSRTISEMEADGLVRRAQQDKRYRVRICLTEAGEAAAAYVLQRAEVAVALAGKGFSEDDRKVFYTVLNRIAANLQEICRDGIPQCCDAAEGSGRNAAD